MSAVKEKAPACRPGLRVINREVNHMANSTATQNIGQHLPQKERVDTPEAAFRYRTDIAQASQMDVLGCSIERCHALVTLLMCGDSDSDGEYLVSPRVMSGVLWMLQGQLDQMKQIVAADTREVA